MPAHGLRVAPRGTGSIVTVVVVLALAVLVGPVVDKARLDFGGTRLVEFHIGIVCRIVPEIGIFGINQGEQWHVGRVEIARILAVVGTVAPGIARHMQAIAFELELLHRLDKSLRIGLILFISELIVGHHESGRGIDIAIKSGTLAPNFVQFPDLPVHESVTVIVLLVKSPQLVELALVTRSVVAEIDHHQHAIADTFRKILVGTGIRADASDVARLVVHVLHPGLELLFELRRSRSLVAQERRISAIVRHLREREIHSRLRKSKHH